MRKLLASRRAYLLARLILAAMFVVAGVIKLADPAPLEATVSALGLLPPALVPAFARVLPVAEILAGLGLALDIKGSLALVCAMLLVFVAVLLYALHLGLDIDCGCYGPSDPEAEAFHGLRTSLYRDLAMLVAVAYLYAWRACKKPVLRKPWKFTDPATTT